MTKCKNTDIVLGGSFLIIGIVLLAFSYVQADAVFVLPGDAPPFLVPKIYLYFWIGISLVILVGGLFGRGAPLPKVNMGRLLGVTAGVAVTAALMTFLGYLIAGILAVCFTCFLLGYRKPVVVALTAIGSVVSLWLLLSVFADLPLPTMCGLGV